MSPFVLHKNGFYANEMYSNDDYSFNYYIYLADGAIPVNLLLSKFNNFIFVPSSFSKSVSISISTLEFTASKNKIFYGVPYQSIFNYVSAKNIL